MNATNAIQPNLTSTGQSGRGDGGHCLRCRKIGLEYDVPGSPSPGRRLGGALTASLGIHACVVLAAVIIGMLFPPSVTEHLMVIQEVFLGSPGGDGSQGNGASEEAGVASAPAPVAQEVAPTVPQEPTQSKVLKSKPDTPRENRQIKPSMQAQSHSSTPTNTQAVAAGDAGQASQNPGTAAHGQGTGAGGNGGGQFEGEFGSGNGPRFAKRVQPSYPIHAKRLGKEGVVVFRLSIDETGRLNMAEIVEKAGSGFDEEALDAVKSSTFIPATLDGRAVPSKAILRIRFQLAER